LSDALDRLKLGSHNTAGDPIITQQGARSLTQGEPLTGAAKAYTDSLIQDLTRASAANNALGAAGSQTFANAQLGGGLLGRFTQGVLSELPVGGALAHGIPGFVVGQALRSAVSKAAAKTESAAIDLLLHPKQLAKALEDFKHVPQARQAYIDTLKDKARSAGRAGTKAIRAFEAYEIQQANADRKKKAK
jgi:hypothetical protein